MCISININPKHTLFPSFLSIIFFWQLKKILIVCRGYSHDGAIKVKAYIIETLSIIAKQFSYC